MLKLNMKVFINYAQEDIKITEKIAKALSTCNANIDIWYAPNSLLPGQKWKETITHAIKNSDYFLALLSNHSIAKKGFVQNELKEALEIIDGIPDSEIFIIPARLEDCIPAHEKLKDIHWVDLFPSLEEGITKIIGVFNNELEKRKTKIRNLTIYPGVGIDIFKLYETSDRVKELFGEPEQIMEFDDGSKMFDYIDSLGLDFFVSNVWKLITEIRFNLKYKGCTTDGIKIGDPLHLVLKASSGATKTVEATLDETHNNKLGIDRVLYKQIIDGQLSGYKFIDSKKGILYWLDINGRVIQIVAFPVYNVSK